MGGVAGFVGGQLLSRVLFPQNHYNQYGMPLPVDPYNNINNFRSGPLPSGTNPGSNGSASSSSGVVVTPLAPTSDDPLAKLHSEYFAAMDAYTKVLSSSGADAEKAAARKSYEDAQSRYQSAKDKALSASR